MTRARVDGNHAAIVKALRSIGASVQSLAPVGKGCPDLLVGFAGRNLVMEVKDDSLPPSARKLTPDEIKWHKSWKGEIHIVTSIDEAIKAVTR